MNRSSVLERLQSVCDDVFLDPVTVTPELSAKDVPEWDSLLHISLMLAVEKNFGVRFGMGEVEATRNLGEFADLILRKLPK
jgi:acyl carrier protein